MARSTPGRTLEPGTLYELAYYANESSDEILIQFLKDLIVRSDSGPRVLDCACGTGEPGIELARYFSMTLTDAEDSLLRVAREKAKRLGREDIRILRARWDELPTKLHNEQFDTVLCCGGAVTQALSPEIRKHSLAGMKTVLRPGGLLYVDFQQWTLDEKPQSARPVFVNGPVEWHGEHFIIVVTEEREGAIINRTKTAYRSIEGELVPAGSALTRYKPLNQTELCGYLEEIGFEEVLLSQRPGRWPMTAVIARRPQ